MDLSYLKTLQRAWDRYSLDDTGPEVGVRVKYTLEDKVAHLTDFMESNKLKGTVIRDYETEVGLNYGMLATFTKWLKEGRLGEAGRGLVPFYDARHLASKNNRPRKKGASHDVRRDMVIAFIQKHPHASRGEIVESLKLKADLVTRITRPLIAAGTLSAERKGLRVEYLLLKEAEYAE